MKVLVVDDSRTARGIVKSTFEEQGHTVFEAPDGAAALSMLEVQGSIDLVVLDWVMPVMNGFDCLRAIRKNPAFNNVKIVMCTTESERSQVLDAVRAGANGYVIKPIDPEALVAKAGKACGVAI